MVISDLTQKTPIPWLHFGAHVEIHSVHPIRTRTFALATGSRKSLSNRPNRARTDLQDPMEKWPADNAGCTTALHEHTHAHRSCRVMIR